MSDDRGISADAADESVKDGFALLDRGGVVTLWSQTAVLITGHATEDVVGRRFAQVVAPDPAFAHVLAEMLGPRPPHIASCVTQSRRPDGAECALRLTFATLSSQPSQADAVAVVIAPLHRPGAPASASAATDGTHRERAEECSALPAAIVDATPDAVISRDLQGLVTSWNQGATAMFGYTEREMLGRSITAILLPERAADWEATNERLRRGEPVANLETQRRTRDGRVLDLAFSASPLRDAAGAVVGTAGILRDITASKAQQREVERISTLYMALSAVNQAVVWSTSREELLDKVCRALVEHGAFAMAWVGWHDDASHRLMPVASHGDIGGYLKTVTVFGDDRPEGRGPTGIAFRTERPYITLDIQTDPAALPWRAEAERRGYRASAAFPIRLGGRTSGTLTVYAALAGCFQAKEVALLEEAAADISFGLDNFAADLLRRQVEARLQSEKQFSDTMIESMPGIVYFYDENGKFLRWNRNFEIISGYGPAEIMQMTPDAFFPEHVRPLLAERIAEVFSAGESSVEAPFLAKDGSATPYFFTGRRVEFAGAPCLVGVGVDISERLDAERERERRHQAEAADQIKSAFLATMSHELRTPLNSIIGFTGIILQGLAGPLNAEQAKQLGMVRSSANHLLALVNDVLDISKIEAGQLELHHERFNIAEAIERACALVGPQAQAKGLALRTAISPQLGDAVADRRRFEQIVLNLLSNAVKFTDQGEVMLTATLLADAAATLLLEVRDTGIGIRAADLRSLFQPFRQIDSGLSRGHDGTGLGLAICQRLCALMGGDIRAASEWGKGSRFTVTLPLGGTASS